MTVRCEFVTLDGKEKGYCNANIPSIFGFNFCGISSKTDIAREVEKQIRQEKGKLVRVNRVTKI
jgi:hypothetical protein